jgi:hypothetical protein
MAVRLADGGWLIVSPPAKAPESVFDKLTGLGPVRWLVAPNAYHHLGQETWRARFRDARSLAPSAAQARLRAKSPVTFDALEDMGAALTPVRPFLPQGLKSPDTLLEIATPSGPVWWMGDLFSNVEKHDQILPLRLFARLAGSGPGFRCSRKPEMVYVSDRKAWVESILAQLADRKPIAIVPAHGRPVEERAYEQMLDAIGKAFPTLMSVPN